MYGGRTKPAAATLAASGSRPEMLSSMRSVRSVGQPVHPLHQRLGERVEGLAGRCEADARGASFEQHGLEFVFQLAHVKRHRLRAEAELRRRLREALLPRGATERPQLPEAIPLVVDALPVDRHSQGSPRVSDSFGNQDAQEAAGGQGEESVPARNRPVPSVVGGCPLTGIRHSRSLLGQAQLGDEGDPDAGRDVVREHASHPSTSTTTSGATPCSRRIVSMICLM